MDINKKYEKIKQLYKDKTEKSEEAFTQAEQYIPNGVTRSPLFYEPYPVTIEKANGTYLWDVDGNKYIDYLNNFGSLIHGHTDNDILETVRKDVTKGTAIAAPIVSQTKLAKLICDRIPSIDQVRFCNSGLEATLFAIKIARAYTNKQGLIMMDGGYHGLHDTVEYKSEFGEGTMEYPTDIKPKSSGISQSVKNDVYIAPFNDANYIEEILKHKSCEIAAIIIEPVMGAAGMLPPQQGYLQRLRKLADEYNVLLIFDEIQTFRIDTGGAQTYYEVQADITTLAKIIGGGFPVGAVGGKESIMSVFMRSHENYVIHSGTFSGNNVSMNAGYVALEKWDEHEIERVNNLTSRLIEGLQASIEAYQIPAKITKSGSMFTVHFTETLPTDYRQAQLSADEITTYVHLALLCEGVYTATRGAWYLSTAMDESHIDYTISAFTKVMKTLKE